MKKLIIIFIIFSGLFYAQNNPRPGIDYMPQIAFFDFVVNYLHNPNGHLAPDPEAIWRQYSHDHWYFDKIKELGLTNLVTDGQYNLTIHDTINNRFFLNDMGFQWKNKTWANPPVIFKPAEYLNSPGHDKLNNFGFTTAGGSGTNMMKPSTVASTTETLPLEYNLPNNYPNPFNPETVIKFSLKEKSGVTLTVYNITDQKVAELAASEMEKGQYEKRFWGISHSSGVYIFRLEAQLLESKTSYSKTMKAMLLK